MKLITLALFLIPLLGFSQVLNIKSIERTDHPYELKLIVDEAWQKVIVDCDSFLHGVFLFYDESIYDWHEINEDSCFDMMGEIRSNLNTKNKVKLFLTNSHPFYRIQPDQLQQ